MKSPPPRPNSEGGGLLLFTRSAKFPLAYKFSEGAGSVVALVTLPGTHLYNQAFGKSDADAVAAVPATLFPLIRDIDTGNRPHGGCAQPRGPRQGQRTDPGARDDDVTCF